ncbi:menaquinone biosynthesis protein [bacterium]|nr:menaquinone biosynthesis protein [bacterium]MCI0604714.1 menaquinone biosynthesis protein [bacterium]
MTIRIAAIRYINTLPLVYGLEFNPDLELTFETPSRCYEMLLQDEVDVALIPIIGTQLSTEIRAIKGLGIAATNRTESVYLFATKPLDRLRTVIGDPSSLTSVLLSKIILNEKYKNKPRFLSGSIDNIHEVLRQYDAALIIGDEAILTDKSDYDHYDLATEWYSITGFPFVFAVWASKRILSHEEKEIFHNAYQQATQNWEGIIYRAASMLAVDVPFLKRYYNENLRYHLARSDYEGLLRFLVLAADFGYLQKVRKDIWM